MATQTKSIGQRAPRAVSVPLVLVALIWFGFNIRSVLLEVPPILPLIQHDLALSYTAVGFLNALPPLIMGLGAFPAVAVIRRFGGRTTIALGLAIMCGAAIMRAYAPGTLPLFALTMLLSVGIALSQTTAPVIVREWFPHHIGQVTAAYSTGLMVGEISGAAFTTPFLLRTTSGGHWRGTFVAWGLLAISSLVLWLVAMPRGYRAAAREAAILAEAERTPQEQALAEPVPTLRTWRGWHISLLLGAGSLLFFAMDTWIPIYYHHLGRGDAALALTTLTVAQLPSALALTAFGQHIAGKPIGFIIAGAVATVALIAWLVAPPSWYLPLTVLIGAASAAIFVLGLSLPPLLGRGHSVAQISGMMLTISYVCAFIGPFAGGALWDLTGIAILAFVPVLIASATVLVLGIFLPPMGQAQPS